MILVCLRCRKTFDVAGALLFSPPMSGWVSKHHICPPCYEVLFDWLNAGEPS